MWMVLIPISTLYFFFIVLFKGDKSMLGWSGIAAVVSVNFVIASYVIMAWNEDNDEDVPKPKIRDYRVD